MTAREHGNVGRSFEMRPDTLVKFFARCDAFRKPQRFLDMLRASECDHRGRTGLELQPFPQAAYLEGALQAAQAIDAGAIAQQQRSRNAFPRPSSRHVPLRSRLMSSGIVRPRLEGASMSHPLSRLLQRLRDQRSDLPPAQQEKQDKPNVFVKELSPRARRHLLRHFLALEEKDRLLRFGSKLSDEMVTRYVEASTSSAIPSSASTTRLRLLGWATWPLRPRKARASAVPPSSRWWPSSGCR
jgi:hypothetical protein